MTNNDWRAIHGGLFLLFVPLPGIFPALASWPWYLLAPLLGYGLVVSLVPQLRHSLNWLRSGRVERWALTAIIAVILFSTAALTVYDTLFHPDVRQLRERLPAIENVILAGVLFSTVNAILEELVFRGVLMDAMESQLRPSVALMAQALIFGLGHAGGYPPGVVGIVMAMLYGLMLGWLRWYAGGLAAPVLAHLFAEATIFMIVVGER